jgi:hypothetical protein
MAKSQTVRIKGKANWAKVFEENREMLDWEGNPDPNNGTYGIELLMDDENFTKIADSGSQAKKYAKIDEEDPSLMRYRFKRRHEHRTRSGDLLEWASGAPAVYHKDGTKWDFETDGYIGNGSEVELKLSVYRAGTAVGTRLEAIRVIEAVPYEANSRADFDFDVEEEVA